MLICVWLPSIRISFLRIIRIWRINSSLTFIIYQESRWQTWCLCIGDYQGLKRALNSIKAIVTSSWELLTLLLEIQSCSSANAASVLTSPAIYPGLLPVFFKRLLFSVKIVFTVWRKIFFSRVHYIYLCIKKSKTFIYYFNDYTDEYMGGSQICL